MSLRVFVVLVLVSIMALESGAFRTRFRPIRRPTCSTPYASFASRSCSSPYYYGTVCTFRCWAGYGRAYGDAVRTCLYGGRWSGSQFSCRRAPSRG